MKRYFYYALFFWALFPGLVYSRPAETMKQRRTRLERKYLHKTVEWSSGSGLFPEAPLPEEDAPEDMEKYKKANLFESDDSLSSSSLPRPRPRPVMRKKVNKNWLLATEEEEETEGDASSFFSSKSSTDTEDETSRKRKQRLALLESMRRDAENSSSSTRSSMGWFGSGMNAQNGEVPSDSQQGGLFSRYNNKDPDGRLLPSNSSSSPFGKEKDTESPYTLFGGTPSKNRSIPSANSGMTPSYEKRNPYSSRKDSFGSSGFSSPFSSKSGSSSRPSRQSNYVPYQTPSATSPFLPQDQGKMGGTDPQKNFQRHSSPYQKWKSRTPDQLDPTRDDAFVSEFMPKTGH